MRIFDAVKQQIIRDLEKLEPHTRLPGRQVLCEKYFVSRDTIDRVIGELCREGYLYTIRNSGTFVSDPSITLNISRKLPPHTIGVLMPTEGINSSILVAKGIHDYAKENGLHVVRCVTGHNPEKLHSYIRRLIISGVSGLLIQPPSVVRSYAETTALIEREGLPVMFMFGTFPGMTDHPLVAPNHTQAFKLDFVYERGYRRMGFVSNHGNYASCEALRTYLSFQANHGAEDPLRYAVVEKFLERDVFIEKVQQMLAMPDRPDVLLCFNDTEAGMVYEAVRRSGLRVSDDVGVIGSDNSPIAEQMDPPLTSVDIGCYDIGYTGISWLYRFMVDGHTPYHWLKVIEPWVVDRASCLGPKNRE